MPAKPPTQPTLFPGAGDRGEGAYGPRKGDYAGVRCPVCGVPWADHKDDCPRHPYRPGQGANP